MNRYLSVALLTGFSLLSLHAQPEPAKKFDPNVPQSEHKLLEALVGVYDVTLRTFVPGKEPSETVGVSQRTMILSGRYLSEKLTGPGKDVRFFLGYDPVGGYYSKTWIDADSSALLYAEGTYDKDLKVLVFRGLDAGADGKKVRCRDVIRWKDDQSVTLEMYRQPEGGGLEVKVFEAVYSKKRS